MNWIQRTLLSFIFFINSIFSSHNQSVELIFDYAYRKDEKSIVPRNLYTDTEVYPKILEYKSNSKFIIVKQKPKISKYQKIVYDNLITRCMIYDGYLKERNNKNYAEITTPYIIKSIKADSLLYCRLKKKGLTENYNEKDLENIRIASDSIVKNDPFYKQIFAEKINYWIIDAENNIRFGPYNKNEFEKEIEVKNISLTF